MRNESFSNLGKVVLSVTAFLIIWSFVPPKEREVAPEKELQRQRQITEELIKQDRMEEAERIQMRREPLLGEDAVKKTTSIAVENNVEREGSAGTWIRDHKPGSPAIPGHRRIESKFKSKFDESP